MQKNGFICRSCLSQLKSLARRQPATRYGSTLAQQATLPASALSLRSEQAPWFLKRRVRRRIEQELDNGLPKPSKKPRRPSGRLATLTRWLEDGDPAIEKEMERNEYREGMARRLFFRQPRAPEEVGQYVAWKDAFYTMTQRRRNESRREPPVPAEGDGSIQPSLEEASVPASSLGDNGKLESSMTDDPVRSEVSPVDYGKVRDELADLIGLGDEAAIREKWEGRELEDRKADWPCFVLASLAFSPRSACTFLRATWEESIAPVYVLHDAAWFLIRRPAVMQSKMAAQDLCDLLIFLLQHARKEGFQLRQWDIYQVVKNVSSDEAVHRFYQELVASQHPLHRYTRLQFAKLLGDTTHYKPAAFEILETLVQSGELDVNSPHAGALCTTILTPSKKELEEAFVPNKLVEGTEMSESTTKYSERLLELGFNPNLITYSVLIRDLIQRKEVKTALDVVKIMATQELKPDALLYSFLLHGAKLSGSWLPMHMLVQQAFLDEIKDPVVWNELLHTVFAAYLGEVRRQRGRRKVGMPAFHPMLKLYASIFKPNLLRKFIPQDVDHLVSADLHVSNIWQCEKQAFLLAYRTPSWSSRGFLDPGYDTITIMILGYINSLSNPHSILDFYLHFKRLVDCGDADAVRLVQKGGTRIYDYVLKALLQWEDNLGTSVGLVNDMLKLSGESPVEEQATSASSSRPLSSTSAPAADVSSGLMTDALGLEKLSLLLDVSTTELATDDAAQFKDAELVSPEIIRSFRHPAPSVHTWSILINGLMFHREADKAERIMDIMKEHGVEPSIVPWNTLLAGYANAQNVRKTAKTLQRLEAAGYEGDDWTFKAWAYLTDKEAALELMEGVEAERTKRLLSLPQQATDEERPAPGVNSERFRAEMEAWEGGNAGDNPGLWADVDGRSEDHDRALQDVERRMTDAAR